MYLFRGGGTRVYVDKSVYKQMVVCTLGSETGNTKNPMSRSACMVLAAAQRSRLDQRSVARWIYICHIHQD